MPTTASGATACASRSGVMASLLPVMKGPGRSGRVQVHHREGERSSPDPGGLDDLCQGVGLRAWHEDVHDHCVTNDIDTLATALYVRTDDLLKQYPDLAPCPPKIGLQPQLTDAELITLAVMQALLGYTSDARWVRHAHAHLGHLFPYMPGQPGYNRRP